MSSIYKKLAPVHRLLFISNIIIAHIKELKYMIISEFPTLLLGEGNSAFLPSSVSQQRI